VEYPGEDITVTKRDAYVLHIALMDQPPHEALSSRVNLALSIILREQGD
jgi:hypothetical protein